MYLFACGLKWEQGDTGAGWQLVESLRSENAVERRIAARFLSLAEQRDGPGWACGSESRSGASQAPHRDEVGMNTPYGLEVIESCSACRLHRSDSFCNLSPALLKSFSAFSHQNTYPGGALLFVEGQSPRGVFVLCSGKVKLFTTSREGKVLILKIAHAGDALGLSAVISATPYEMSAETSGPCQVNFVDRESLVNLVKCNGELGLHAAQSLSREFQSAYRDIHDLVLARSSSGKLAKLLLSWTDDRTTESNEIRIRSSLTHEEIAQMIGSSRETVTRLLSSLKQKQVIRIEGSMLVIRNRRALESLAA